MTALRPKSSVKRKKDLHTVGLLPLVAVIIETSTSFGRSVIRGVGHYGRENGPWALYLEQRSIFDPPPGWLKDWHGQGIICNIATAEIKQMVQSVDVPLVALNDTAETLPVPSVLNDDIAIGRMAAEHLLENGFRNCGFVGHEGVSWSDGRLEGFRQAVLQAGGTCDVFRSTGHHQRRFGERPWETELSDMMVWLKEIEKPMGLMAATDFRALQVLDACRQADVSVPENVAVIGVGDEDVVQEAANPGLSSVLPNAELVGMRAAAILHQMMDGKKITLDQQRIEPIRVVTRQSTSLLAIQDVFVAKAMQFIRQNACNGINVHDVLHRMKMSRTALQQRFLKQTSHTIHDEIIAVRINRIKELLSRTDLAIPLIADRVGITCTPYLSVLFKKHTGMTLSAYRQQKQSHHLTDSF